MYWYILNMGGVKKASSMTMGIGKMIVDMRKQSPTGNPFQSRQNEPCNRRIPVIQYREYERLGMTDTTRTEIATQGIVSELSCLAATCVAFCVFKGAS